MVQRYAFLHKTSENENIFVLNFINRNYLKVLLQFFVTILSLFCNRNIALSDYFRNFAAEIKTLRLWILKDLILIEVSA